MVGYVYVPNQKHFKKFVEVVGSEVFTFYDELVLVIMITRKFVSLYLL